MASAVLAFAGLALLVIAYLSGKNRGSLLATLRHHVELERAREEWATEQRERAFIIRTLAFARAAEAATLWPHRINKRADLARHIDSLGSAPDLAAAAAPPLEEEHLAASPNGEPSEESDREVDAYRHEGFL